MTPAPPRLRLTSRCSRAWDFHQHVVTECLTVLGAGRGAEERVVTQLVRSCREANQPGSVEKSRSGLHGGVGWGRGPGEGRPPEGALNCLLKFEQDFAGDGGSQPHARDPSTSSFTCFEGLGSYSILFGLAVLHVPSNQELPFANRSACTKSRDIHSTKRYRSPSCARPGPGLGLRWGPGWSWLTACGAREKMDIELRAEPQSSGGVGRACRAGDGF